MKNELTKKEIIIEVVPEVAVSTIGLLRGLFPSIIEELNARGADSGIQLTDLEGMSEVLNEIYEKCIAQTDIREKAADFIESLKNTGTLPDDLAN